jgi:hypothetical protein
MARVTLEEGRLHDLDGHLMGDIRGIRPKLG